MDVYCKFCGGKAYIESHSSKGNYYRCPLCGASRPCTKKGAILTQYPWRSVKQLELAQEAHSLISLLCSTREGISELYIRLAKAIQVPVNRCHFKTMSVNQMSRACKVLREWVEAKKS